VGLASLDPAYLYCLPVYSPRALTDPAPTLLTVADYCGTLAAARLLGDLGSRVTVADPSRTPIA
jgi:hypothetical protein